MGKPLGGDLPRLRRCVIIGFWPFRFRRGAYGRLDRLFCLPEYRFRRVATNNVCCTTTSPPQAGSMILQQP